MTRQFKILAAVVALGGLSACGDNDFQRGVTGAAAGAVIADQTGNDVATGAAVGATAGVICDDVGIC